MEYVHFSVLKVIPFPPTLLSQKERMQAASDILLSGQSKIRCLVLSWEPFDELDVVSHS